MMMMMMMMTSLSHYAKANTSESSYSNPQPPFHFQSFYYSLVVSQNKGEINVLLSPSSNALLFAKHYYAVPNSNTDYFSQFSSVCRLDLI